MQPVKRCWASFSGIRFISRSRAYLSFKVRRDVR